MHGGADAEELSALIIIDPEQTVLYKRQNEKQGIIMFNTTVPGEYSFIFANFAKPGGDKSMTMAIHTF